MEYFISLLNDISKEIKTTSDKDWITEQIRFNNGAQTKQITLLNLGLLQNDISNYFVHNTQQINGGHSWSHAVTRPI